MIRPLLTTLAVLLAAPALAADTPLSVLFLGDRGHHDPADRAAQIRPVLALRGIDVTYTEDVAAALSPATLGKYDALLIYANIDRITPEQQKALFDYVESGGGFAPIHCASYCFLNSPEYVDLVGARFQRHGTGEFDVKTTVADHPITKSLAPFRTWDETYVHEKHNTKDRLVLQTRSEGSGHEPWTWVRTQGKGRVFYTAYGHDGRTWQNPGFHDLLERGLRWAANKGEVYDSRPRVPEGLPAFTYSPAKVPNYVQSNRWGAQGELITKMQNPLDPAQSARHMTVPKGFALELFASDPDIAKPICMAWDHRGRLWIAETTDYPNEMRPKGQGRDRIRICEDTNGDGKADKFTVFAEKLSIPTSIAFSRGGIIVHQAPDTLFLKDTDGDDKADVREVLFTGWSTGDTHAGPSNLRYGLDNKFYGIVGYAGFQGRIGGETQSFRTGLYRFKPDTTGFEFLRNTNNNSWGVGISEDGLLFGSTANGCPYVYLPVPNRYYESVRGWSSSVLRPITVNNQFFPITEKVRQVDWFGGFTAGAGAALYTARTYPQPFWNSTAFVNEPTGHLTATFTLERKGADVSAFYGWNLVASNDEWSSPIIAEVGPDGQVWVVDWYNFIVQHNPTPEGFKTGNGAAYETPLRDKTHGRIYRVVAKDGKPSAQPMLDANDAEGLVAALKNDNMLWRLHAQRMLVERGKADVAPALIALASDASVDPIGLNTSVIHAIWTLDGLGALKDGPGRAAVLKALTHASAAVRRNAVLALPKDGQAAEAILGGKLLSDPDAQVRLAALLALADAPASDRVAEALVDAAVSGAFDRDPILADAATSASAKNDAGVLAALAHRGWAKPPGAFVTGLASRIAEHHARGVPAESIGTLLAKLRSADGRIGAPIVAGLLKGWPKDRPAKLDDAAERAIVALFAKLPAESKSELIALAGRWGSRGLDKYTAEIAADLMATAKDDKKPEPARIEAARRLMEFRPNDADAAKELLALITPRTSPALATGLVTALGRSAAPNTGAALVAAIPTMTPGIRTEALRVILSRGEWAGALMEGIEGGKIQLAQLALDQKQALAAHPDKTIAAKAKALLDRGGGLPDADRQKVIEELTPILLKDGDAAKGKLVFEQNCTKCHKLGGQGGEVGPDLTGIAAHPKAELIVHILDPSRSVEGNFVQYTLVTTEGRILNGKLVSESKTAVELMDAEGKTHKIVREEIDELAASTKSLMPEGFEKQVPPASIADLLTFLTKRGKFVPLDLRKAATVVSTKGMFYDADSDVERLVFPDWTPKTVDGVPFVLVDPQGDKTPNAVLLFSPNGTIPPKMPKSVALPYEGPARAIHLLSGVSGWGFPYGREGGVAMIVRLHYADGTTEDHPLRNGVHFADYIRVVDVPQSKLAFKLRAQQIRYLTVAPKRTEPIKEIEFVKGPDVSAPVVMGVTVETPN